MPYAKQGRYIARPVSRRTGDDDSRIAAPPASAWICSCPAHPAALEQSASGGRRLAVSGPAAAAQSQARQGRVDGFVFDQSPRACLPDYESWIAPPGTRDLALRTHARRSPGGSRTEDGRGEFLGDYQQCAGWSESSIAGVSTTNWPKNCASTSKRRPSNSGAW